MQIYKCSILTFPYKLNLNKRIEVLIEQLDKNKMQLCKFLTLAMDYGTLSRAKPRPLEGCVELRLKVCERICKCGPL